MLVENKIVDKIEVLENGCVQVRTRFDISKDNVAIASSFDRKVINPGDDFSQEDEKVRSVCSTIHTPQVVNEYKESRKKLVDEIHHSVE
tara:strand:- start:344 stop:610 length:267 start_codon:yes stop_codon:yes gene_type:complete